MADISARGDQTKSDLDALREPRFLNRAHSPQASHSLRAAFDARVRSSG